MDTNTLSDSPYVGLQPFSAKDQKYFFGRERDSRIISSNLFAAPLTVLYGSSGVGKSSVLQAGVVPMLRKSPRTAVVSFQRWPEKDPIQILKTECLEALRVAGCDGVQVDMGLPFDEFLFQVIQAFRGTILILLDQFEEYFLYHPEAGNTFDAEFARAINREDVDANFLIALREDSLSMLDRFRTRIPNLLGNSLRLRHLDGNSAREAICKPLDIYNQEHPDLSPVRIEPELVDALIKDVRAGKLSLGQTGSGGVQEEDSADEAEIRIEAPFLQLILTRLWDEEKNQGFNTLRLATLNKLGGASKIVQTHLDRAMEDMPSADQGIAANIFRYLVTPSGTKIAYTVRDLAFYANSKKLESVLEKLAGNVRILRKVTLPGEPSRYEIYHDVLGAAILDWRARYETDKQQEMERLSQLKQQQDQAMIRWSVAGTLAELLFIFLPVGVFIVRFALRRQEQPLHRKQIRSVYLTWLLASIVSSVIFIGSAIGIVLLVVQTSSVALMILFLFGFGPSMIGKLVAAPYFALRKYRRFRKAEETTDIDVNTSAAMAAGAAD